MHIITQIFDAFLSSNYTNILYSVSDNVNKAHRILYSRRILLKIHGCRLFYVHPVCLFSQCTSLRPRTWWDFICCCHPCFYINLHAVCELACSNDYTDKQGVLKLSIGGMGPPMYHLLGNVISATVPCLY